MAEKKYYAHSLKEKPESEWQALEKHLTQTAEKARTFAEDFGGGNWAFLAGLWHDIGKYSPEFQKRLGVEMDSDAHIEITGRPDHSTAGARHAHCSLGEYKGKLLAYAIAGHHTGIPDGRSFDDRLKKKKIPDYSACPEQILNAPDPGKLPLKPDKDRRGFQIAFFIRMIYSCLVDADFLDTENFFDKEKASYRTGYPDLDVLNRKLRQHLETLQKPVNTHFPDINKHRADILRHCLDAAERQQGLFLLTVPTGGGKTLSSLAFALKHALKNGLKRVIYVIPYTSIIEQNAAVFRKVLGDEAVLEHHSNFEPKQEDRRSRLASENWDAPVIVTTNVQFFESLFRRKSSRCRKIHNIAKSVVILDEAQMLPVPLLLPCLEVLKALSSAYGTTVVLCTATQPALKEREDFRHGLKHVSEIVPDPDKLYNCKEFKRVHVKNLGKISDDELAEKLKRQDKVLCILNTRKYARLLYEKMGKQEGICHLSALMCPAHRTEKFEEIRNRLDNEETPCRVISTQLIEAGVDIDFPTVFRSLAGIDSIAQAAGRCNREGKLPEGGHLYIFSSESDVHPEFRQNAEIAEMVMREHEDILSLEAIKAYFQNLFWLKGESRLDEQQILKALNEGFSGFNFPFEETDRNFKIIKNDTFPVIIPYNDKARELIQQLRHSDYPVSIARKLQRFTVQVYSDEFSRLLRLNSLESLHNQQYHILSNMSLYRDDLGLALDK